MTFAIAADTLVRQTIGNRRQLYRTCRACTKARLAG